MKRKALLLFVFASAASWPAAASAPAFETPAPVAYMVDLSSGAVLFQRDSDRSIPPASMAKMMTTHVAFDLIKNGQLQRNRMCHVSEATWRRWHSQGSTMFLSVNERVSVENLLRGIVIMSGNDASVVLAECIAGTEAAFVALMNQHSQRLGLANSRWGNPVGWPDNGVTRTTARDLATLARATIEHHPELYREFYGQTSFTWGRTLGGNQPISQGNRNPLLGKVPGADGLKTGHTEEAGYGFTGSAVRDGRRIVMVVAGLDSYAGRATEAVRFMNWGFDAWTARPLFARNERVGEAQVQLGGAGSVGLLAQRDIAVTLPAGGSQEIRARIVYQGPVKAPIQQGQHVADLVVTAGGVEQTMPLVAAEAVEEAGFFRRILAGLRHLFGGA